MLYGNTQWLYAEDFLEPTRGVRLQDDIHSYEDLTDFFADQRDANFAFAALLVRIMLALVKDIEAQSGATLLTTAYGPCFSRFSSFDCGRVDALFANLYRRESYSVVI